MSPVYHRKKEPIMTANKAEISDEALSALKDYLIYMNNSSKEQQERLENLIEQLDNNIVKGHTPHHPAHAAYVKEGC
jgi:hypothetical protein